MLFSTEILKCQGNRFQGLNKDDQNYLRDKTVDTYYYVFTELESLPFEEKNP